MNHAEERWRLLCEIRGLLSQGWFYKGSFPGESQSECRTTECSDLLGLVAELCGDCDRMADALNAILLSAMRLNLGTETLKQLIGLDLVALAKMHTELARGLAATGNRALDIIGGTYNGTQRQQFDIDNGTETPDSQRVPSD